MTEKKTAGQIIAEHDAKNIGFEGELQDYRIAMAPDMETALTSCVQRALEKGLYGTKDFYVVLVTVLDRMLLKPKFMAWHRQSCPTPVYKQHVYKYHRISGSLEYLWTLPTQWRYSEILQNRQKYLEDPEYRDMARFVILDATGELLNWVKKENGEKIDAVIKINKETECSIN